MVGVQLLLLALTAVSSNAFSLPKTNSRKYLPRKRSCPFRVESQSSTNIGIPRPHHTRHYANHASRVMGTTESNHPNGAPPQHPFGSIRRKTAEGTLRVVRMVWALVQNWTTTMTKRTRTLVWAVGLCLAGSASLHTAPSHAVRPFSLPTTTTTPRTVLVSSSGVARPQRQQQQLDKIVDDYVTRHMFDAERFDAFESAYQEAYEDSLTDTDPAREILKREGILTADDMAVDDDAESSVSLMEYFQGWNKRLSKTVTDYAVVNLKMDPRTARSLVALVGLIGYPVALLYSFVLSAGLFRSVLNWKQEKKYGERRDLSATEKDPEDYEDDEEDKDDGSNDEDDE